ncbi:Pol [Purpureocillium lilacinum]|uniref:Pol n=1 Tax=Purpureocillium lilacinum TaxID=33203 RepID=A0A179EYJ9_PURLI|nr:Pol [Purpureocillium lilacinum]
MTVTRKPLPNPPKYNGSRKNYATWAKQMRDKLELDAHYYNGNRDLWYLVNSCLEERVQQVVATFYAAGGPGATYDPHEFMRYLDRTYQDSNIQSRAATSLRTLRQREKQSLASFLPRFEQALAEAGGADWPDRAKIVFLENALSQRLQRSLVSADLPTDYHGWLARVQEIAGRMERLGVRETSTSSRDEPTHATPRTRSDKDHEGDTKMADIGRVSKESAKPRREARCYRCGREGHFVAKCPARVVFPDEDDKPRKQVRRAKEIAPRRKRAPGPSRADIRAWAAFKPQMRSNSVLVDTRINRGHRARALVDSGCDCYAVIDEALVKRLRIPFVDSKLRKIGGFSEAATEVVSPGVVAFMIETGGYDERIFAYVIPGLGQDLFLGLPWMEKNKVVYDAAKQEVYHGLADISIRLSGQPEPKGIRAIRAARLVSAAVFAAECRRQKKRRNEAGSVRAISLSDIEKALQPKQPFDPSKTVPRKTLDEFGKLFSPSEAMKLPPHRPGVDHEVNLQRDSDGNEPTLPWGPLYNMSREELLVLRKTLTDLLDRGFIRASSSAAAAPVLFVRKPNGGLRFCCDYRALNAITKRDRYPLPLIAETLQNLTKAKWFTKLDVVAAFHKIRMAPGHEEKTAFRTRFGLYEWLVCPFGLSGAPASFQRYMNSVLRKYLDDFVTAYLDDVLIYSSGSRADHESKVRRVLESLADAQLHLDPAKCEFSVQEVKYLGFIVRAGKGIACDPEKQRAIREWEAPTTVKGVRSFLGFANYYRIFIPDYARITAPLDALLRKGAFFRWLPYP